MNVNNYEFSVEFKPNDVIALIYEMTKQWTVKPNEMRIIIDGVPMSGKSEIAKILSEKLNMRLVRYSPKTEIDREFNDFLKDVPGGSIIDGSPLSLLCSLPNWKRYIARYVKTLDSIINRNYPTFMILVEPLNNEDIIRLSSLYDLDIERAEWIAECVSSFEIMSKTYEVYRHVRINDKVINFND